MNDTYPDDADGAARRRVAALGANMSAAITIDFFVAAPNYDAANAIARVATRSGDRRQTPLDDAIRAGNEAVVKVLTGLGAVKASR